MDNPLQRRLEELAELSDDDKRALADAVARTRDYAADQDIAREGDRSTECHVLLSGFACRHKLLDDGTRQIIGFQIPGDFCDLTGFVLGRMDHGVATVTPATLAVIPHRKLEEIMARHPALVWALWRESLADASVSREWVANVGARSAYQRLAHLITEMGTRLKVAGLAEGGGFEWPFTQAEVGDATGLSTVHVNRTLQQLRADNLIEQSGKRIRVADWARLEEAAAFSPNYLFVGNPGTNSARPV